MADYHEPRIGELWSDEEANAIDEWCEKTNREFSPAEKDLLRAKYGIIFREDTLLSSLEDDDSYYVTTDSADEVETGMVAIARPALVAGVSTVHQVKLVSMNAAASFQASLNKPLPPIPSTKFAYDYATRSGNDYEQTSRNSIDNLSFDAVEDNALTDSASSVPDLDPVTPPANQDQQVNVDLTAIGQLSFLQAGIHLGTKDIVDNHLAALGTGLEGHLEIDEADQLEKEKASIGFYGGFQVEESPSQFHAPVVEQDSGYGDIREGLEDFPELWTFDEKQAKVIPLAEAEAMEYEAAFGHALPKEKVFLHPNSQKTKIHHDSNSALSASNKAVVKKTKCSKWNTDKFCSATLKAEKRAARDSFVTRSIFVTGNFNDDEPKYLGSKRIRNTIEDIVSNDRISKPSPTYSLITDFGDQDCGDVMSINARASEPSPTYSLITDLGDQGSEDAMSIDARISEPSPTYSLMTDLGDKDCGSKISVDESHTVLIASTAGTSNKGFHGQFTIFDVAKDNAGILKDLNHKARRTGTMSYGDRLHPNYVYANNAFALDLRFPAVHYTTKNLRQYSPRHFAIMRATDLTEYAASNSMLKLRTASQENLRKEAHIECSAACLEGVSVGRYRYYQGSLGVEEYNQAGMCICWDICACTKMCSRFGDLICPCAEDIVIQKI